MTKSAASKPYRLPACAIGKLSVRFFCKVRGLWWYALEFF